MPRVPEFVQRENVISSNPRGVDITPSAYGAVGDAFQGVGQQVTKFAGELLAKRKEAEDTSFAFSKENEDLLAFEERKKQASLEAGPDGSGYAQSMKEFAEERFESNQKEAPSETARQLYMMRAGDLFARETARALGEENIRKARYYDRNIDEQMNARASTLVLSPSDAKARESLAWGEDYIESLRGVLGHELADKKKQELSRTVSLSLLDGYYTQENYDAGLREISRVGKKDAGGLLTGLEPHELAMQKLRFQKGQESKARERLAEFRSFFDDQKSYALETGTAISPKVLAQIDQFERAKVFTPGEAATLKYEMKLHEAAGEAIRLARIRPSNELGALGDDVEAASQLLKKQLASQYVGTDILKDPAFGAERRQKLDALVRNQIEKIIKERQEDPAQAAINAFPQRLRNLQSQTLTGDPVATKLYTDALLANQEALGIPRAQQRVTTKSQAESEAQLILGTQTSDQTYNVLGMVEQKYGEKYPKALSEIAAQNKEVRPYVLSTHFADEESRRRVISNAKNAKDIVTAFKGTYPDEQQSLSERVRSATQPLVSAIAFSDQGGDSLDVANTIQEMVELDAKKRMSTRGIPASKAVSEAYEIVSRNFAPIQGGRSSVVLPRRLGSDGPVRQFLDDADEKTFKKLGVGVPKDVPEERWFEYLAPRARFVTNPSQTGMRMVLDLDDGRTVPVFTKDRTQVEILYQDIFSGKVAP